jgi:hypothetical protein
VTGADWRGIPRRSTHAVAGIAAAGVTWMVICAVVYPQHILSRPMRGDLSLYFRYAQRTLDGQIPYHDFALEYPPAALAPMLAAGPADDGYDTRFRILMLVLAAVVIVLLTFALHLAGATVAEIAAGVLVFATLPVTLPPGLVFERFDLWPAALVLAAMAALLCDRRVLAFAALGAGAAAKVFPLVLLPLALLTHRGRERLGRDLAAFVVGALVFIAPFIVLAPRGLAEVGSLLVRRPLQVESLGGSILLAAHRLGAYEPTIYLSYAKSWDLAGPVARGVAVIGSVAEAAALVAIWYLFARSPRGRRELLLAAAAAIAGFVAFGKILSPQYLVWVAAIVPLALGRTRPLVLTAVVTATLFTVYLYNVGYDELLAGGPISWMLVVRNLVLVGLFGLLLSELAARADISRAPRSWR